SDSMVQRTSDRFARGTSYRSGNRRNGPTGGDDSGVRSDNQHSEQRPRCLDSWEHTNCALEECTARANAGPAAAVRNDDPMVVRFVFKLVEPTAYGAAAGSRAARKGGNNCCARPRELSRKRFSRTIHRLQA